MHSLKKLKTLLLLLLNINFFLITCLSQNTSTRSCGKIQIQTPFLSPNLTFSSPLNRMILCRSQKLYFRTSLGLFPVSSIDYETKTLTISHPSCSSSQYYFSPSLLSAGFPSSPPQPNSLLLFNCTNKNHPFSSPVHNCSHLNACAASSKTQEQEHSAVTYSCLIINDTKSLDKGFHPNDLSCSHYSQVYKISSDDGNNEEYELGTRISFDIPDHVPNICNECEKPNGNCGIGLKCVCHPQQCKDKVISIAGSLKPYGNVFFSVLSLYFILVLLMNF